MIKASLFKQLSGLTALPPRSDESLALPKPTADSYAGSAGDGTPRGTSTTSLPVAELTSIDGRFDVLRDSLKSDDWQTLLCEAEKLITPLRGVKIERLEVVRAAEMMRDAFVLQRILLAAGKRIRPGDSPKVMSALRRLLADLALIRSPLFKLSCALMDKRVKDPPRPMVLFGNTMKKAGDHSDEEREEYEFQRMMKFIEKGGRWEDIQRITPAAVHRMKDDEPYEFGFDYSGTPRMATEASDVGHPNLILGGPAQAAGTLRRVGDLYVIGTKTGHYLMPSAEPLKKMADLLVSFGIDERNILLEEGDAAGTAALELLLEASGVARKDAQAAAKKLEESALPLLGVAEGSGHDTGKTIAPKTASTNAAAPSGQAPHALGAGLNRAEFHLDAVLTRVLKDSVINANEVEGEALVRVFEDVFHLSTVFGDKRKFSSALARLKHLVGFDATHIDAEAKAALKALLDKYTSDAYGAGIPTVADAFGPRSSTRTRIGVAVLESSSSNDFVKAMNAGASIVTVALHDVSDARLAEIVKAIARAEKTTGKRLALNIEISAHDSTAIGRIPPEAHSVSISGLEHPMQVGILRRLLRERGINSRMQAVIDTREIGRTLNVLARMADAFVVDRKRLADAVGAPDVPQLEKEALASAKRHGIAIGVLTGVGGGLAEGISPHDASSMDECCDDGFDAVLLGDSRSVDPEIINGIRIVFQNAETSDMKTSVSEALDRLQNSSA